MILYQKLNRILNTNLRLSLGLTTPISNNFQWSNPVPTFNLEFGVAYQRFKFKVEPKVSYAKESFSYGLTTKLVFVIWKSK